MNESALSDLSALGKRFTTEFKRRFQLVTLQVRNLSHCVGGERTLAELLQSLGLKDRPTRGKAFGQPALANGLIEMTIPDRSRNGKQRHGLTDRGRELQVRFR